MPIFQANQLTQALVDIGLKPIVISESFLSIGDTSISITKLVLVFLIAVISSMVIVSDVVDDVFASCTVASSVNVPAAAGVPLRIPVEGSIVRPSTEPLQRKGRHPVAARLAE